MKAIVIALALFVAVYATQDEILAQISKIDSTPLGRALFDTIAIQLEAGDPLDTLLGTLHELEDRYIAEQKEDDAANQEFQMACNADIAAYDKDLAESNRVRIDLEARLEGVLYPQREIMTGIVNQKQKELDGYRHEIDVLDAERAEEAAEFEEKVREHEEATAIITEARRLFADNIEGAEGEAVFLQRGKVNGKARISAKGAALIQKHFQTHAKKTAKFQHRKAYSKLFKVLATIASKSSQLADTDAVGRIVQLCDELLFKIEESLDLERFAEDKRIEAYKAARNLLTISVNQTSTDLANAQTELASINDQITQTETSLDNTNLRIENLEEAREDRWNQCEEAATDYMDARAARDADRQVVSDVIGLVNQQLRTLKEALAQRMAAGDSFE